MPISVMDAVGGFVTTMTKPDNMAPIIASEGLCIAGRTRMAYKRGKEQEARERVIEETTGAVTWLYGVRGVNYVGDKIVGAVLHNKGIDFDTGSDIMRKPFENFMHNKATTNPRNFSSKKVSLIKGAKVIMAILLVDTFIGFVVPKCNQALSRKMKEKDRAKMLEHAENRNIPYYPACQTEQKLPANIPQPAFMGIAALNKFTNLIENTNTGKLVATDVGIATGRGYNARRKEESLDVVVRDGGSIYFYYWARGDIGKGMNLIETGGKTCHRLDPQSVNCLNHYLEGFLAERGGYMNVKEFTQEMFGTETVEIPDNIEFRREQPSKFSKFMTKLGKKPAEQIEMTELSNFLKAIDKMENLTQEQKDKYKICARNMSSLQPKQLGIEIISKNQIVDVLKGGEINSPKFLHTMFDNYTNGLYKSEYKYVSHKDMYKHKEQIVRYIEDIISNAKDNIDLSLLKSAKNKNLLYNGINFAVGFTVAVAFLSTLIPKFQYYITRKVFGYEGFPGDDKYGVPRDAQSIDMAA